MFQKAELRKKLLFTLFILVIYRIGVHVPVPGTNQELISSLYGNNALLGLMNAFSGGAMQNFSIFAIGVMPYITASIIVQLLGYDVVPSITEWKKQGEYGQRKIKKLTYVLTAFVALAQGIAMSIGFNQMLPGSLGNPSIGKYIMIGSILALGTGFLVYLGEKITKKGISNGISVLIYAGIIASLPQSVMQLYYTLYNKEQVFISIVTLFLIGLAFLMITMVVIVMLEAVRKIPISYSKQGAGKQNVLPIKVNTAGVIPIIFAVAIMMMPTSISALFPGNKIADWISIHLDFQTLIGMLVYGTMIFLFTYFYAFIQVDPKQVAENLKLQGGYVQGIRPGKPTENYLRRILSRLTFVGAIFLVVISILPFLLMNFITLPQSVQVGGTSLLIAVGVALEISRQIKSHKIKQNYKTAGFLKNKDKQRGK